MTDTTNPDPDTVILGEDDVDTFDLDAWIDGAAPATRTVSVYGRADLDGRRKHLEQRIKAEESPRVRAVGGESYSTLRREWQDVWDQIQASKVDVTVRGLAPEKIDAACREYRKAHKIDPTWGQSRNPDQLAKFDQRGQVRHAMFEAVVEPKFRDREQYDRFLDKIGPSQETAITEAWNNAQGNAVGVVTTDFSPQSSDDDDGRM